MIALKNKMQHVLIAGICCIGLAGCSPKPLVSDPVAAKKLLGDTLEAWKSGKSLDDLKSQTPPTYVGDQRWASGAKLIEFSIVSDGEYHQSSVKLPVRMKTNKDAKAREVFYWVTTNPANSVVLAD